MYRACVSVESASVSLKKSLAWLGMAQTISIVLQFASSVVLARYLTPYETGIFAVAIATMALLSLLQQLGLNALIVREEVLTDEVSQTSFAVNALISVVLSVLIVAASYGGALFLRDEGVRDVLLVLAVVPLFGIPSFLPGANLERKGRFKELALISTTTGVIGAGTTIALAVLGFSYMSSAYAQVASSAAFSLMLSIVGRRHFSLKLSLSAWRRVADFGLQMLAVAGISTASQRLSEIMLGRLLGLSALGLYTRASGLNNLLWGNLHLAVGRVLLVDLAELNRQGISLRDRYKQTVAIATATLWPAFAGLAVIAEPFVRFVYGDRWVAAVVPFIYLAIASMILVAITMTWELFTATGRLREQTRIEFKRGLLSFAIFVGACMISLEAAAAARIVDAVISLFLYRPYLNRMTDTSSADFWGTYLQSALLTLLAIAPAGILMMINATGKPSLALVLSTIALGVLAWVAGLFALKHPLAAELNATMSYRWPRLAKLTSRFG